MNTKKIKKTEHRVNKPNPTIFPLGFGVKKLEDDIIIIDFVDKDIEGDENFSYVIINSIAMSKIRAIELKEAIEKAVNEDDDDNS